MATHSGILACRMPSTEEPGRLQSVGSDFGVGVGIRILLYDDAFSILWIRVDRLHFNHFVFLTSSALTELESCLQI